MVRSGFTSMRVGFRTITIVVMMVLALVAAACGSNPQGSPETEQPAEPQDTGEPQEESPQTGGTEDEQMPERVSITVAPGSPSVVTFVHYWIAEPLGFYEDENLDVELIAQVEGGLVQQALELRRLDFGGVASDVLVRSAAEEEPNFKIFMHDVLWSFFVWVLEDSPYQTGEDLRGETIGISEAKDESIGNLMMSAIGLDAGEYETLVTGGRAPAAVAMERGESQAFVGSRTDEHAMREAGYPVRAIDADVSAEWHNTGIAAPVETLEDNPELAIRFGRAVARAWVWAYSNPESAIELLEEVVPESVTEPERLLDLLNATIDGSRALYEARGQGNPEAWQEYIDLYAELGFIDESFDPARFYTDELLDEIWDFDVEALEEAARNDERPQR